MDIIATQYLICFCLTSVCEFFIEGFAQPTKNDILLLEIDIFEPPTTGNPRKTSKPEAYTRRTSRCFYKC